jgi:hypothetical protein
MSARQQQALQQQAKLREVAARAEAEPVMQPAPAPEPAPAPAPKPVAAEPEVLGPKQVFTPEEAVAKGQAASQKRIKEATPRKKQLLQQQRRKKKQIEKLKTEKEKPVASKDIIERTGEKIPSQKAIAEKIKGEKQAIEDARLKELRSKKRALEKKRAGFKTKKAKDKVTKEIEEVKKQLESKPVTMSKREIQKELKRYAENQKKAAKEILAEREKSRQAKIRALESELKGIDTELNLIRKYTEPQLPMRVAQKAEFTIENPPKVVDGVQEGRRFVPERGTVFRPKKGEAPVTAVKDAKGRYKSVSIGEEKPLRRVKVKKPSGDTVFRPKEGEYPVTVIKNPKGQYKSASFGEEKPPRRVKVKIPSSGKKVNEKKRSFKALTAMLQDTASRLTSIDPSGIGKDFYEMTTKLISRASALKKDIASKKQLALLDKVFKNYKNEWATGDLEKLPPEAVAIIKKAQPIFERVSQELESLGLPPLPKVEGLYWPNRYDPNKLPKNLRKSGFEKAADEANSLESLKIGEGDGLGWDNVVEQLTKARSYKIGDKVPADVLKALETPSKSLDRFVKQVTKQAAEGEFFGKIEKGTPYSKLIKAKVDSGSLSADEKEMAQRALYDYFSSEKIKNPTEQAVGDVVGTIQRLILLGKLSVTSLRQAIMTPVMAGSRYGLKGILDTFGGKRIKMGAVDAEIYGNALNDRKSFLSLVEKMLNPGFEITQRVETYRGNLEPAAGFLTREAARALKTGKPRGMFKTFLERMYPEEAGRDFAIRRLAHYAKNNKKLDLLSLEDTITFARMKGTALSRGDKVRFAQKGTMGKGFYNILTWTIKNSNTVADSTIGELSRGNVDSGLKNILGNVLLYGGVGAATEQFINAFHGRGSNDPMKDYINEYKELAFELMMPLYNKASMDKIANPENWDDAFFDQVFKGARPAAKLAGDISKPLASGDIAGIFDPEVNPSLRLLPSGHIGELKYLSSRAFQADKGANRARQQAKDTPKELKNASQILEVAKEQTFARENPDVISPSIKKRLSVENVGKPVMDRVLARASSQRVAATKYGTLDEEKAKLLGARKAEVDKIEDMYKVILATEVSSGRLTQKEADKFWQQRSGVIERALAKSIQGRIR